MAKQRVVAGPLGAMLVIETGFHQRPANGVLIDETATSFQNAVGTVTLHANAQGVGLASYFTTGTVTADSTVSGVGALNVRAAGTAAGAATVSGVGATIIPTGTVLADSTVTGVGRTGLPSTGTAAGLATVVGRQGKVATGTVLADSSAIAFPAAPPGVGLAFGESFCAGEGTFQFHKWTTLSPDVVVWSRA